MTMQQFPIDGSVNGSGGGDCDREYLLVGWRPRVAAAYPFSTRQLARLMILRSRIEAGLVGVDDMSEPVRSSFGYHLIRLEGRHPATARTFDQVKESILAAERTKFIDDQRDAALASVKNDPATKVNQAAVDALIITIDPEKASKASAGDKPK